MPKKGKKKGQAHWVAREDRAHDQASPASSPESDSLKAHGGRGHLDSPGDEATMSSDGRPLKAFALARVGAAFYPKFENEAAERQTRLDMAEEVEAGTGVVEVSVKHSGSLFLWAGAHHGAYAKNSHGNQFTAVGVWVLAKTLENAWGGSDAGRRKQQELSDFVESNRLAIGMELVTSVLGDHGQRPKEDYVVVTSVADISGKPRFFSTSEMLRFCRTWRLPHNSYWLFSTRPSVERLFAAYDALKEEGTAQDVENALASIADTTVPGTADHVTLQGNIMEGVVARLVAPDSLRRVTELVGAEDGSVPEYPSGAGTALRQIFTRGANPQEAVRRLVEQAGPAVCSADQWGSFKHLGSEDDGGGAEEDAFGAEDSPHEAEGATRSVDSVSAGTILGQFLGTTALDPTTKEIQELLRLVKRTKMRVRLKCFPVPSSNSHWPDAAFADDVRAGIAAPFLDAAHHTDSFVTTVHVTNDGVFRKFKKLMSEDPKLWPLFRGFFINLMVVRAPKEEASKLADALEAAATSNEGSRQRSGAVGPHVGGGDGEGSPRPAGGGDGEVAHLMVKMKLLPYKLRTFLIRNGLRPLSGRDGDLEAYRTYYKRMLKTWGTSPRKTKEMTKLCEAWASHALQLSRQGKGVGADTYLDAVEPFLEKFASESAANARAVGALSGAGGKAAVDGAEAYDSEGEEEEELVEGGEGSGEGVPYGSGPSTASGSGQGTASGSAPRARTKFDGLLVFFPGIPGCAKSSIAEIITKGSEGFEDGRQLDSLMGDMTKGKYWQVLAQRRKSNKKVNTIADKNAPNFDVWKQVREICENTNAVGVPVVPDSPGMHRNPFDLKVLAVFMFRVLQRKGHPGNLDQDSVSPGHVVLMFHSLYTPKSREELERDLRDLFGHLVKLPIVREGSDPLPQEVEDVIDEGLSLERRLSRVYKHKKVEPQNSEFHAEFAAWEAKLRRTMDQHRDYLLSIQVPLEEAAESVRRQLADIATGRVASEGMVDEAAVGNFGRAITFAAINFNDNKGEISKLFNRMFKEGNGIRKFLQKQGEAMQQRAKNSGLHVTLAHRRSDGVGTVAKYARSTGQKVQVQVTALAFNENCAALTVDWPGREGGGGVVCTRSTPHITLWTAPGVPAYASNEIIADPAKHKTRIIPFEKEVYVEGSVALH